MAEVMDFLKEDSLLMDEAFRGYNKEKKRKFFQNIGKSKITILYGLRGTGKTTLMAQKYFAVNERIAINGEHLKISGLRIKDLIHPLGYLLKEGYVFIDEITRIKDWPEELKVMSDLYPKIRFVVSGSSSLGLIQARRILARRADFIRVGPLSFNEYLNLFFDEKIYPFDPFSKSPLGEALKTELDYRKKFSGKNPFDDFMVKNLPYLFENSENTILDMIERVIYEDISIYSGFNEETLQKFWKLLYFLALSDRTSYSVLSRDLGVGKGTIIKMLDALIKTGLIKEVIPFSKGKSKIRKEPKYLFASPVIRRVILKTLGESNIGMEREDLFALNIYENLFYFKEGPDYLWKDVIFEIGGKSKGTHQLRNLAGIKYRNRFIVYDGLKVETGDILRLPFYVFLSYF